jgi:predicted peroxiredoxin
VLARDRKVLGAVEEPHTPLARPRSRSYADLVKILYLAITGSSDPTRASIPLHIAANGSVEAGQECAVVLAGDATELVSRVTAERVEGVGVPPAKELFQKLLDHQVPVYV